MHHRLLAASLLPLLAPTAAADLITWGPVQDVVSSSEVATQGTLITGRNPWASSIASPTVNNTFFEAFSPPGWGNGGWSLMAGGSTGDLEYDALLDSARVTSGGSGGNPTHWGGIRLDILGQLVVGNTYLVQVWYSDQRTGTTSNVLYEREMLLSSATGAASVSGGVVGNLANLTQGPISAPLNADPNDLNGATDTVFGSYCIGTFTRTSTDELWLLVQGQNPAAGNLRPHINAFQIRDVTGLQVGTNYCTANANSTGSAASMSASGSSSLANNNLVLEANDLPLNAFGFFLTSTTQGLVMNPGGSQGNLCLGGSIGRYVAPGQIQNSGTSGAMSLAVDLTQHPTPTGLVAVQAGETWNFQAWYRDAVGAGATSNFTDGLEITF